MKIAPIVLLISLASTPAAAGLKSWSVEKDADPFSGGDKVSITYMDSFRSGVFVMCDTAEKGIRVRSVPGFAFEDALEDFTPTMKFAFDGKVAFDAEGTTGRVGDNVAAAEVLLTDDKAKQFVDSFATAKKQIAIDDGISDKPSLLTARGSTTAGAAIVACLAKQTGG